MDLDDGGSRSGISLDISGPSLSAATNCAVFDPHVPFEPAKYRYFFFNIVFIAQLQPPAVTKVEIQSANLVQFLKARGLKFCVK